MPKVKDPNVSPYDAVALLKIHLNTGATGWGTGSLIHPNHILTCGHNLASRITGPRQYRATKITAFPGWSSDKEPKDTDGYGAQHGFYVTSFVLGDRSWDIAVIRLGQAVRLDGYMVPYPVESEPEKKEIPIAGYPGAHHFEMWEDNEVWTGVNVPQHIFAYVHETEAGSSGSPLFVTDKVIRQVGVHSGLAENLEDKVGVLITAVTNMFVQAAMAAKGPFGTFLVSWEPRVVAFDPMESEG